MDQADATGARYAEVLVARLVGGAGEADLVAQVKGDLDAAGRSDLGREAGSRFAQAWANASGRLHGTLAPRREPGTYLIAKPASRPHAFWGWTM